MTRHSTDFAGGFGGMNPVPTTKVKSKLDDQQLAARVVQRQAEQGGWTEDVSSVLSALGIEGGVANAEAIAG